MTEHGYIWEAGSYLFPQSPPTAITDADIGIDVMVTETAYTIDEFKVSQDMFVSNNCLI